MRVRPCLIGFTAALTLLLGGPSLATADTVPTADGFLQDGVYPFYVKDGIPDAVITNVVQVLNVPRFEDRGVIEFNVSNLSPSLTLAELRLSAFNANGPFPLAIDVYAYAGDGVLSLADWSAGAFVTSFPYSGQSSVTLDVTAAVRGLVSAGQSFAGFNLRFERPSDIDRNGPYVAFTSLATSDRPPSELIVRDGPSPVPGPGGLALCGLAALSLWVGHTRGTRVFRRSTRVPRV